MKSIAAPKSSRTSAGQTSWRRNALSEDSLDHPGRCHPGPRRVLPNLSEQDVFKENIDISLVLHPYRILKEEMEISNQSSTRRLQIRDHRKALLIYILIK